ncbi:MAG TPA: WecB/TagA/CpsF family glycosyltransferase, partial [Bacteroidota bacterium]|nr:WecB/TagA/CpsF family glycosyltransferase [Bacteroidota bacterium]
MPRVTVARVGVDVIDRETLQASIRKIVDDGAHAVIAYANIHAVNVAWTDRVFAEFLERATLVYCDGEGVRLGARLLGTRLPPRVVLTYWIWDLCSLCEEQGYSIFLLGSTEETVGLAIKEIRRRHPALRIAGYHHGYFAKSGKGNEEVLEMIRASSPHLLFVGFGMPAQEHWIAENAGHIAAHVILPCGSMIDYVAGRKRAAPPWMADHGMEWVFRLLQE